MTPPVDDRVENKSFLIAFSHGYDFDWLFIFFGLNLFEIIVGDGQSKQGDPSNRDSSRRSELSVGAIVPTNSDLIHFGLINR